MEGCPRVQYQLKRIGKAATVMGVQDLMKITKDVTRFGRHSENDYFLDSSEYLCMVSRWHAELHRVEQAGQIQYMLRDNSLNGTYVNNVRVKGNQVLQEGDLVMFGHPNGKTVKPGEPLASTLQSEFCFVFEPTPSPAKAVVQTPSPQKGQQQGVYGEAAMNTKLLSDADPLLAVPGSPLIQRVSTTLVQSVSSQEAIPSARPSLPVNRRLLTDGDVEGTPGHSTVTILKDISNVGLKPKAGLLPLEQLIKTHGTVSPGHIKAPSRNQHAKVMKTEDEDAVFAQAASSALNFRAEDSGSEQDIFDSFTPISGPDATNKVKACAAKPSTPMPSTSAATYPQASTLSIHHPPKTSQQGLIASDDQLDATLTAVSPHIINQQFQLSSANTNKTFQVVETSGNGNSLRITADKQFLPIPENVVESYGSPSRSLQTSPSASRNTRQSNASTPTGRGVKRSRSETPTRDSPSLRGKSKKRRKGKRWTQVKKRLNHAGEEEEEGDAEWHFDGDLCDSIDCYRPAGNTVNWVACDDCEKWYHTVCVGTSYAAVSGEQAQFHCGCV